MRLTLRAGVQGVQIQCDDGREAVVSCPYALDLVNHTLDALAGHARKKNLAALDAASAGVESARTDAPASVASDSRRDELVAVAVPSLFRAVIAIPW